MATTKVSIPNTTPRPITGEAKTDMALQALSTTTLDPLLQAVILLQTQVAALNKKVGI